MKSRWVRIDGRIRLIVDWNDLVQNLTVDVAREDITDRPRWVACAKTTGGPVVIAIAKTQRQAAADAVEWLRERLTMALAGLPPAGRPVH